MFSESKATFFFTPPPPSTCQRAPYPWEKSTIGGHPKITKEFFHCRGSALNQVHERLRDGKASLFFRDCDGHGLPLRDGKEFVYPVLIELLNYIQEKTEKRVVITTGHRCRQHNSYCDNSSYNWGSKHMLGAEVDFYVEGLEKEPEKIVALLQEHCPDPFSRYEKGLNVSTPAWYNKEIFIKLYKESEGRDFDNQHTYPYLSIQVRYDRDLQKRVVFDEQQVENYLRR